MSLSRCERKWLWCFSVLVMMATFLPYLYAVGITPPDRKYQWLLYNPDEPNVHLAWMRQACDGKVLFIDPFTTEPQKATFFHGLFLLLGNAARLLNLPLVAVYHSFRFVAGVLLLHAIYWLTATFFRSVKIRRTALCISTFASGLGWLAFALSPNQTDPALLGLRPVDVSRGLMIPEGFTFPSLLLYPLFTFSMFLMVSCFLLLLRSLQPINMAADWRKVVAAGFCGLILGNVHTYDLLVVYAVSGIGMLSLIIRRIMRWPIALSAFALFVAISCPGVVYQYLNFQTNPVFREKALTLTPPRSPLEMAVSYGFILLLAAWGSCLILVPPVSDRQKRQPSFLVLWLAVGALIIYAPVSFSRKMIEGLHIPMSILAAVALTRCVNSAALRRLRRSSRNPSPRIRHWQLIRRNQRRVITSAIVLMSLSNLQFVRLLAGWVTDNNVSRIGALMPPYFLSKSDVAAADWIKNKTPVNAVVLCAPFIGSYIPELTGRKVFIGHWAETLHFPAKFQWLVKYLRGKQIPDQETLAAPGVPVYLVYGQYERMLAPGMVPRFNWREVFRSGDTIIYELVRH